MNQIPRDNRAGKSYAQAESTTEQKTMKFADLPQDVQQDITLFAQELDLTVEEAAIRLIEIGLDHHGIDHTSPKD